ncbi:hypothetical protein RDI58_029661 [Solanum bulbocastanum]|uniref:Uncharacterized protein n=1 Tax=Solanum bulbocastanum TaxID=147425 RepID=A0AAN8SXF2_SOLBU
MQLLSSLSRRRKVKPRANENKQHKFRLELIIKESRQFYSGIVYIWSTHLELRGNDVYLLSSDLHSICGC